MSARQLFRWFEQRVDYVALGFAVVSLVVSAYVFGLNQGERHADFWHDLLNSCEDRNTELRNRWFLPGEERPNERPWTTQYPANWACELRPRLPSTAPLGGPFPPRETWPMAWDCFRVGAQ